MRLVFLDRFRFFARVFANPAFPGQVTVSLLFVDRLLPIDRWLIGPREQTASLY